ncbi:hypothetical protein HW090_17500 [Pseudomonas sp. ABC1]|uniref:hypothetical protein n=1 Tax=Pseudomonas sp. ABC1 TaxID=2748080 RepID=UPI0015C391EA|nr:hypothetical protein [Pseudomonas sp. ABC1]QLF94880.1 hypothetical protein HW090_17500 [Pseudomonas sp. ABC1]
MAGIGTVFSYGKRSVKLGYKPLSAFFRANLDRKRQIWPAGWCGLHYVRHQAKFMTFDKISVDRLKEMGIDAREYHQQLADQFGHQSKIFKSLIDSFWNTPLKHLDHTQFNAFFATTKISTEDAIHDSAYDFFNYLRCFKDGGKIGLYKHRQAEWKGPIVRLAKSDCPNPKLNLLAGKDNIYRGMSCAEFDSRGFGQSWTTDIEVARKFATATYEDQQDGIVAVTSLNFSNIIHVFECGSESEVVVDIGSITSVNRLDA